MKGSIERIMNLIYFLQMIKALSLYEIKYPGNSEIMIDETRKLIDFEALKPDNIIKLFVEDFDLQAVIEGTASELKERKNEL